MRPLAVAIVVLSALACEKSPERALSPGRLAYRSTHQLPAGADTTLSGVLLLDHVSEDSIAGSWRVPGLAPELVDGRWRGGAYEAEARATYFGTIAHRIRVDPTTEDVLCDGDFTWVDADGIHRTTPVECDLSYGVPFELEPVESIRHSPNVRSPGADTLP